MNPHADLRGFSLASPPPGFIDDPYPCYAALRERSPVHEPSAGSLLLRLRQAASSGRDHAETGVHDR